MKNDSVHNVGKVTKTDPTIMSNPHAHPHTMKKTHAKFQNNGCKNCKRSCAHKIPMLNADGWTDGQTCERTNVQMDERTNGRKLACLCLPAKAGATKMRYFLLEAKSININI